MRESNSKKTLIVIENLPAPFDRRVWSEATTLHAAGIEVSIICPMLKGYDEPYEEIDGIHIYRHPLKEAGASKLGYLGEYFAALFHQFRLSMLIRKERGFDVIHACNPPDLIFIVALFHRIFFGTKFIFDHHDLCPELFMAKFGTLTLAKRVLLRCVKLVERATFMLADISIATNKSYKKIAVERGRMAPEDVFVVRSGPRLDKLKIQPAEAKYRKGFEYLVGYVGVIGEQEGLDLLVDAVDNLVNCIGRTDTHFAIIGDGPARASIVKMVVDRKLEKYFSFYGRVDDRTFLSVLNSADVCVNSDRYCAMNDLSTMNKIVEYMALAKPIIQFDLTEGRVSAGKASLYARHDDTVDFANKIDRLLSDPIARHEMGEFGRRRVEAKLSWKYSAPVLLRAYSKVFNNTKNEVIEMPESVASAVKVAK